MSEASPPSLLKRMPCALLGTFQAPSDHSPDKKRNMPSQGWPRERASQATAPSPHMAGRRRPGQGGVNLPRTNRASVRLSLPTAGGYAGTRGLHAPSLPRAGGYMGTQALPSGSSGLLSQAGSKQVGVGTNGVHLEALSPREKKHCCFLYGMNKSTQETFPPLLSRQLCIKMFSYLSRIYPVFVKNSLAVFFCLQ